MRAVCPNCRSRNVRFSRAARASEHIAKIFGVHTMRCRECLHRFSRSIWRFSDMLYAHCPRCYNLDLGYWTRRDYHPGLLDRLKLRLGASPYRCGHCRTRFTSFRQRKQKQTAAA